MNQGKGASSSTGYAQAMVDQRPAYDNAIRKGRMKKRKKKRGY